MRNSESQARNQDRTVLWGVAGLSLLAFGLRLVRIDADSIWWDEGISLHLAQGPWGVLVADRAGRLHPPLYFMLLKLWVGLAGDSVFSARTFSLLGGLPGVTLAHRAARRYAGQSAGWVAAGLAAVAAIFVTYAQEARVYALLPVTTLLLLALADQLAESPRRKGLWAWLAIVEAAALLLHYLSAISIVYVNLRLIARLWPQRREVWNAWLASHLAALALTAPWFASVLVHRSSVRDQFALGSSLSIDPLPVAGLVRLVWTFLMTGHDRARFVPSLTMLAGIVGGVLVLGCIWLATRRDERRLIGWPTADWLLPITLASALWFLRPLSHPRYTLLWAGTLWVWAGIVLGRLLASHRLAGRVYGALGILAALTLSGFSVRAYLNDPSLAKQDIRGVAALLREAAAPGDVILVPWQDQSLPYYDTHPASVAMIDFRDTDEAIETLATLTEHAGHVFVMEYDHTTRDPLSIAGFALERAGSLEETIILRGVNVSVYRLDEPVRLPQFEAVNVDIGDTRVVGVNVDPTANDDALTVALAWEAGLTPESLKATVQLLDGLGNTIALDDRVLLDPSRKTSDEWSPGSIVVNTYVLPLPKGTPPVDYTLGAAVYPAAETRPGDVQPVTTVGLLPPTGRSGDPYKVDNLGLDPAVRGELASGLTLTGALYFPREATPGDKIDVLLRWEASSRLLGLEPSLRLSSGDLAILDTPLKPANGQYPTDRWSSGEIVLDRRRFSIPPDAPPGKLALSIALGEETIVLGDIDVVGGSTFETPRPQYEADVQFGSFARLVGYDIASAPIEVDGAVALTLYWEALGPADQDYTVFAHLVDANGVLVGQHDFPPVGGQRPTSSWKAGEYLVDVHAVSLNADAVPAPGEARLMVGFYNPDETFNRVLVSNGGDSAVLDVRVDLP